MYYTFIQLNAGKSRASHDCLQLIANERNADIILISEPNTKLAKAAAVSDKDGDTMIWLRKKGARIENSGSGKGFCYLDTKGIRVISCYASPNRPVSHLEEVLTGMSRHLRGYGGSIVVAGDLNAKSPAWNSSKEDRRGEAVTRWMASLGLSCMNKGNEPTFVRDCQRSIIDVTLGNDAFCRKMQLWEVVEDETLSLHKAIIFTTKEEQHNALGSGSKRTPPGWSLCGFQEEDLVNRFRRELARCGEVLSTWELKKAIDRTCDATLRKRGSQKTGTYWWNETIRDKRKTCTSARRKLTRLMKRGNANTGVLADEYVTVREEYRQAKKSLRKEIDRSKREKWAELIEDVEKDPWGLG